MAPNKQATDISRSIESSLKRINLVTGKGGVGRSTLAAVLAKQAAASGKKTLLAELENHHGADSVLARMFQQKHFHNEPSLLETNLYGMTLSAPVGQSVFLNSFLKINALTQSILKNKGVQWFLEGAPAFKEMGYFYHMLLQLRKRDFECIVVDLPATGHLVGLARLPRILLRLIPFGPIAERLKEGQSYLYDSVHTAAWIVTLPQTLPVSEAIELKNALCEETVPVGGFILNRAPFNPFTSTEESEVNAALGFSESLERIRRLGEAREKICTEIAQADPPLSFWIADEVFQPTVDLITTNPLRPVVC